MLFQLKLVASKILSDLSLEISISFTVDTAEKGCNWSITPHSKAL